MTAPEAAAIPPPHGPVRRLGEALAVRLARLRLRGLTAPVGVLVVGGWGAIALFLTLAAIPGLLDGLLVASLDPPTPRWIRAVLLAGCAFVAAGNLVTAVVRDARARPSGVRVAVRDFAAGATGVTLGALLLASDEVVAGSVALGAAAATVITLHLRIPTLPKSVVAGMLGCVPWIAALVAQFAEPDFGLYSWVWIILLPLAAGFAAFGALYGVARAAETRTDGLRRVFRDDLPAWAVALALGTALAIVVARYSVLRGLFGDDDTLLWTFRVAPSWIHGAIVAVALIAVAVASTRRPLTRIGRRFVTAGFGLAAALQLVLLGPLILTLTVSVILTGAAVDGSDLVVASAPWISVGLVVLLAIIVAHPVFAGSAGRWMAWLGGLYALPGGIAVAAGPAFDHLPAFWTKPPQVVALLALGAAMLFVVGLIRPGLAVPRRLLLRIAIIPLVAVHATALLPAPWESALGRTVLVLGVALAVLLFAPAATADPMHRGERLLRRTTAQVGGLVVFTLALPSVLRSETFEIIGTLWLAIPVAAVLCLTVLPRTTPAPGGSPPFLVDAETVKPDQP